MKLPLRTIYIKKSQQHVECCIDSYNPKTNNNEGYYRENNLCFLKMRLAEAKHELREHGNLKRPTRQFRVSRVLIAAKRVSSVNKKKKPIAQCCRLCHLIHHLEK